MNPAFRRPTLRRYQVNRDLAILLLTVAACAIPFLSQPFHMDDNFYMDMARNALLKPLYPNDIPYVFEGRSFQDMGSHSHPPLMTYFLALNMKFAGEGPGKEWVYHSSAIIFPLLAVFSFYFLAARFVERPLWPSLLLACSPLFTVMQHNLMTDVPTLAFWLAAIACFLWAADTESRGLYLLSATFQFAAMFTSYQSAALIPLLGFYQLRRRGSRFGWVSLVVPIAGMAAWFGLNYLHYHRFLLLDTTGFVRAHSGGFWVPALIRTIAVVQYQGWLVVFPAFLFFVFARGLRGRVLSLIILGSVYLTQFLIPVLAPSHLPYRLLDKAIFAVGLAAGSAVMLRMACFLSDSLRDRETDLGYDFVDSQFLGLWYWGVLAYCLLLFIDGSARYILPLVPPLLIYYFRWLEIAETIEYRLPSRPAMGAAMAASGSLVFSLAWGMLLSQADLEFARVYPRAARDCARISGSMTSFFGGEWGFRYYFRQEGFRQLPSDDSAVPGGSWLARPKLALPYDVSAALNSMTVPVQTLNYDISTPIRLLDWQTPAGFYSTGWGLIPFSLSGKSLELIEMRQVDFLVERLPLTRIQTGSTVLPWPGYLEIQGRSPLALLVKPEACISYPWDAEDGLDLELLCGVAPQDYDDKDRLICEFEIRRLDGGGKELSRSKCSLQPGVHKEDRGWQTIRIRLAPRSGSGDLLELSFRTIPPGAPVTGAFAEALLRPVLNPAIR